MNKPRTSELAAKAGISRSYSSEILSGKRRPSRALAICIFRTTGWRHDLIKGLSDEQIAVLEHVENGAATSADVASARSSNVATIHPDQDHTRTLD